MPIGSAIEGILLSFGLADRINILRQEKELSQAQALASATENARIIRDQNVIAGGEGDRAHASVAAEPNRPEAGPEPAGGGREDVVAGSADRGHRPRDQQPDQLHPEQHRPVEARPAGDVGAVERLPRARRLSRGGRVGKAHRRGGYRTRDPATSSTAWRKAPTARPRSCAGCAPSADWTRTT